VRLLGGRRALELRVWQATGDWRLRAPKRQLRCAAPPKRTVALAARDVDRGSSLAIAPCGRVAATICASVDRPLAPLMAGLTVEPPRGPLADPWPPCTGA